MIENSDFEHTPVSLGYIIRLRALPPKYLPHHNVPVYRSADNIETTIRIWDEVLMCYVPQALRSKREHRAQLKGVCDGLDIAAMRAFLEGMVNAKSL